MIIRDRPAGWQLFLVVRGSILRKVALRIAAVIAVAAVVTWQHGIFFGHNFMASGAPLTILGLALSIFLGFRNTVAYDRFWEGRRLWGDLVIVTRTLSRQLSSLVQLDEARRRRLVRQIIAFTYALKHQLRDTDGRDELRGWLEPEVFARVTATERRAAALLVQLGRDLSECLARQEIPPALAVNLDSSLTAMDRVLGGCERIKSTPIPYSYSLLLHRTAYLYCFLMPFGLSDAVGLATPLVAGLVAYTFFGLDALGDEIEEPFGTDPNDLPLSALCRTIEINLLESLGETDVPPALTPVDFILN